MFGISNEVAYNNKMICKTSPPDPALRFLFSSSVWLDCRGFENGNRDHTVIKQVELALKLLKKAIAIYNGLPDLYIITPFTSVASALKKSAFNMIEKSLAFLDKQTICDWLDDNCGTIHTFQGKEANEVLLVLGCDAQNGFAAAKWVGQKPNIINVAVSRAKYRLTVIGDYDLWNHIPYVEKVCQSLQPFSTLNTDGDFEMI